MQNQHDHATDSALPGNASPPPQMWRSLDELAQSPEFLEWLHREFPQGASAWSVGTSRRDFLKLMGASIALAGFGGCGRPPQEQIIPYVDQPEQIIPGRPLMYATATLLGGYAIGALVESHMGRPTKVEGNPEHPASLGASNVFAQAEILALYDPGRSQTVVSREGIATFDEALSQLQSRIALARSRNGAGLRILTETVTSPTLGAQLERLLEALPEAQLHHWEPINRDAAREGALLAFGQDVQPIYHFDQADVVVSLGSDFTTRGPGAIRYTQDLMGRRRLRFDGERELSMNRLYVAETMITPTGSSSDHRLPASPSELAALTRALAARVGVDLGSEDPPQLSDAHTTWVETAAADLQNGGAGVVIAGDDQPPELHALAHAMNEAVGSIGTVVTFTEPIEQFPATQTDSLRDLCEALNAGEVETLLILGGNPVYTSPVDFDFTGALAKADFQLHLSLYEDETSARCQWHVPALHSLESWSDARAYDGTVTILQPLIAPLYSGVTAHGLVAAAMSEVVRVPYEILRSYWRDARGEDDFETFWRTAIHDGLVEDSAAPEVDVQFEEGLADRLSERRTSTAKASGDAALELSVQPDPSVWDGRFSNNAWLQELPRPITKITWDNVALVSLQTADELQLSNEDVVELSLDDGSTLTVPVWVQPGHAINAVTLHMGYGRRRAGSVGTGVGSNAFAIMQSSLQPAAVRLRKTGRRYPVAVTQHHHLMEGRHLVRAGTLDELRHHPEHPPFVQLPGHHPGEPESLYPEWPENDQEWGMVIDLTTCIGCNACVIACQAENNIPVVGKEQVRMGREMHWIRVDSYYEGDPVAPTTHQQPVTCMHCEHAPCEIVCPVAATVHGDDGLNQMIYNRCVGTRYCSNNCPYKVRRFNYLQYTHEEPTVLTLMRNPDVTVRSRGVMEKCTYCVQRISTARIEAEKERRPIRDGEVQTACQAACPADAIIFGNLNDADSQVTSLAASPLNYGLLAELNTRPRTTYLASVRNPNEALPHHDGQH